jgi:hypothetical protein
MAEPDLPAVTNRENPLPWHGKANDPGRVSDKEENEDAEI